jgi:hypothetical protein
MTHYLYAGKWEQAREHQERALAVVDALPSSWWKAYPSGAPSASWTLQLCRSGSATG